MQNLENVDIYFRFLLALGLVILLASLIAWMSKFLGLSFPFSKRKSTQRRLEIVDALVVDSKRRFILLKRDDVEHLILTGGANELVIETDIKPPVSDDSLLSSFTGPSGAENA